MIVGQNTEIYRSLTNSRDTVNASEIVNDINEIQRLNNMLDNGTDVNAHSTILILHIISACAIITFVIVELIFISRQKTRQ